MMRRVRATIETGMYCAMFGVVISMAHIDGACMRSFHGIVGHQGQESAG